MRLPAKQEMVKERGEEEEEGSEVWRENLEER